MEYTDLTIIDCNRQHSVQTLSGNNENPALYTNELGRGIKLNVGDKVSIQGAYISEIGAGADTIEFKGNEFGKTRTITYVKEIPEYPTSLDDDGKPLITGYQQFRSEKAPLTYVLKDNETYITNQFYLTVNGESGYVFLPRRFVYDITNPESLTEALWGSQDTFITGRTLEQLPGQFCSSDYMFIPGGNSGAAYDITSGFYRLRSDNSRYTLMRRIDPGNKPTQLRATIITPGTAPDITADFPSETDPSRSTYIIYQNNFKISVPAGFNSPENIGEEITRQLKETDGGKRFTILDNQGNPRDISLTYTSNNYQPFLCSSLDTFNDQTLSAYNTRDVDDKQGALDYNSNFYNTYCKRPDLRMAGQNINTPVGLTVNVSILRTFRHTSTIVIDLAFNKSNLERLRDLFKVQKKYPELFDNENFHTIQPDSSVYKLSVKNTRYLHINRGDLATELGGDNLKSASDTDATAQSVPLFFYFQEATEDTFTGGENVNDLSYGIATNNGGLIELHPELIGGINDGAFNTTAIIKGTKIGYDWSFNAYGTAHACGINGRSATDYDNVNTWGILNADGPTTEPLNPVSGLLRQNYVGAINPIFEYDTDQSRFYFSGLHTPELAGQSDIGAGDNGVGDSPQVDNTVQGAAIVYKINKRVNKYTYTPDMRPYESVITANYARGDAAKADRKLTLQNRNIKSWAILDSIGGIFISDLGYDKEDFSRGLWGILGFTYDSLFSEETELNNRTVRISPTNINKLSLITTNSDVVESDTRDYIVNQFGAVYYTNQIPTNAYIKVTPHDQGHGGTLANHYQTDPAISQGTSSVQIIAQNLPRKMLRPYYTIRSDIIDSNHFIGGDNSKTILPVIGVCSKQYSGGDFFFGADNDFIFTITKGKTITSITTSITDPNQTFSRVDNDTAVIYKIMKQVSNEEDLIQDYLKSLDNQK